MLLRDWDFERFFPNNAPSARNSIAQESPKRDADNEMSKLRAAVGVQKSRSGIFGFGRREETTPTNKNLEDRVKSEIFANKVRNEAFLKNIENGVNSKNVHKRQESDSKISLNFVRGFRRENTDFFPLSKRHSAILGETSQSANVPPSVPLRSSAIFRRGNQNKGEPILTDFSSRDLESQVSLGRQRQQPSTPARQSSSILPKNLDFLRPRREKTESVIVINKNRQQQQHQQLNFSPKSSGSSSGSGMKQNNQQQQSFLEQQQQQKQSTPPRTQVMRPGDASTKHILS